MAFCHPEFKSLQGWSRAVYSPDGRYVASGSNLSGVVFIWDVSANKLQSKLTDSHNSGVVGIDWCSGNNGGQQVATVDRKGSLILWA